MSSTTHTGAAVSSSAIAASGFVSGIKTRRGAIRAFKHVVSELPSWGLFLTARWSGIDLNKRPIVAMFAPSCRVEAADSFVSLDGEQIYYLAGRGSVRRAGPKMTKRQAARAQATLVATRLRRAKESLAAKRAEAQETARLLAAWCPRQAPKVDRHLEAMERFRASKARVAGVALARSRRFRDAFSRRTVEASAVAEAPKVRGGRRAPPTSARQADPKVSVVTMSWRARVAQLYGVGRLAPDFNVTTRRDAFARGFGSSDVFATAEQSHAATGALVAFTEPEWLKTSRALAAHWSCPVGRDLAQYWVDFGSPQWEPTPVPDCVGDVRPGGRTTSYVGGSSGWAGGDTAICSVRDAVTLVDSDFKSWGYSGAYALPRFLRLEECVEEAHSHYVLASGYCYLNLYEVKLWRSLADQLGPSPLISDLPRNVRPFENFSVIIDHETHHVGAVGSLKNATIHSAPAAFIVALGWGRLGSLDAQTGMGTLTDQMGLVKDSVPAAEYKTPPLAHLNNAIAVPDEALFSARDDLPFSRLGAETVPSVLSHERITVVNTLQGDNIQFMKFGRNNTYFRSFPDDRSRLPQRVEETSAKIFHSIGARIGEIPIDYIDLQPLAVPFNFIGSSASGSPLQALLEGDSSPDVIKQADKLLSTRRMAGTRGNRQILGWEANLANRAQDMTALAMASSRGQRYLTFMTQLWIHYFDRAIAQMSNAPFSLAHGIVVDPNPRVAPAQPFDPAVILDVARAIGVQHLSARFPPAQAAAAAGPEDPLWANQGAMIDQIAEGYTTFIDAEGLTKEQLQLAIKCFAPYVRSAALRVQAHTLADQTHQYTQWPGAYLAETPNFLNSHAGTTEFAIHWGTKQAPANFDAEYLGRGGAANANAPNSPWNIRFSLSTIRQVMEHWCVKHHAWADCWAAFDIVAHRFQWFSVGVSNPAAAANAPNVLINAFGERSLALPRNFTLPAYFDCFRPTMPTAQHGAELVKIWNLLPRQLCWLGNYATCTVSTAFNWAARSIGVSGEVIDAFANPAGGNNDYERNHADTFTRQMFADSVTPWARIFRKAVAMMYGTAPTDSVLLSLAQKPARNYWHARKAPFFQTSYYDAWALKMVPFSHVLPAAGEVPAWPEGELRPAVLAEQATRIRLARATVAWTNRAYVQDGGFLRNMQFYAAAGMNGGYRFEATAANAVTHDLHNVLTEANWNVPFQYEWSPPTNEHNLSSLGARGSVFADYIAPTSLLYRVRDNRVLSRGIRQADNIPAAQVGDLCRRWFEMTSGGKWNNVCLAYQPPINYQYQPAPVADYSMVIYNDWQGDFSHIDFVPINAPQASRLAGPSFQAPGSVYTSAPPPGTYPAYLSNAEPAATLGGRVPHPVSALTRNSPSNARPEPPSIRALAPLPARNPAPSKSRGPKGPVMQRMEEEAQMARIQEIERQRESDNAALVERLVAERLEQAQLASIPQPVSNTGVQPFVPRSMPPLPPRSSLPYLPPLPPRPPQTPRFNKGKAPSRGPSSAPFNPTQPKPQASLPKIPEAEEARVDIVQSNPIDMNQFAHLHPATKVGGARISSGGHIHAHPGPAKDGENEFSYVGELPSSQPKINDSASLEVSDPVLARLRSTQRTMGHAKAPPLNPDGSAPYPYCDEAAHEGGVPVDQLIPHINFDDMGQFVQGLSSSHDAHGGRPEDFSSGPT